MTNWKNNIVYNINSSICKSVCSLVNFSTEPCHTLTKMHSQHHLHEFSLWCYQVCCCRNESAVGTQLFQCSCRRALGISPKGSPNQRFPISFLAFVSMVVATASPVLEQVSSVRSVCVLDSCSFKKDKVSIRMVKLLYNIYPIYLNL